MAFTTLGLSECLKTYYNNRTGLELRAYDSTPTLLDTVAVTYSSPNSGTTDLEANATFTLQAGETVATVELWATNTTVRQLASETLTVNNSFPNGGDLIVTSYELSVQV